MSLPNPLSVDKYPAASSGPLFSWHTVLVFAARVADVADKSLASAPALSNYTEFPSWQPGLQMGQLPGGMLTRGYGKKFGPESGMPTDIRRKLDQRLAGRRYLGGSAPDLAGLVIFAGLVPVPDFSTPHGRVGLAG